MAEIVSVVYTASDGTTWPFQMEKLIRIKKANFHNWTYNPNTRKRRFGVRVLNFGKAPAAYQTTLYFGGSVEYRKKTIDDFHTVCERDIRKNIPGRLTWGNYYIDCFIRSSSTYPEEHNEWTINDVEIYCPYPFWIEPAIFEFYKAGDTEDSAQSSWLDYDYGYDYDYSPREAGAGYVINNAPGDANFRITFFGAAINPYVYIGDTKYAVNVTLSEGEYLTIDSMDQKVLRHLQGGATVNAFNDREKGETSIFTPIPVGRTNVIWPAQFGVEIMIYQERSEPAWT